MNKIIIYIIIIIIIRLSVSHQTRK